MEIVFSQRPTHPPAAMADETSKMPQPETPAETKRKEKSQEELIKLYAGADGELDELDKLMMKYDADCSGSFCIAEVKTIIHDLQAQKDTTKHLARALVATILVSLIIMGVLIALMILSIEVTKENKTRGGQMVDLSGGIVDVGAAEEFSSIFDIPKLDVSMLSYMKTITFYTDMTDEPDIGSQNSPAMFKLAGAIKRDDQSNSATFFTDAGTQIFIDGDKNSGFLELNGKRFDISDTPKSGRRLEEVDAAQDELKCKDAETCKPKSAESFRQLRDRARQARQLRRGGASMTAASFEMSSSSNRSGNS